MNMSWQACNKERAVVTGASRRLRCCFTLVELLVAIGIVMLLMALLFPSLSAARRQAKITACQSNLRSLAQAWQMYLDEYDGYFLKGRDANWNYGGIQGNGSRFSGIDPDDPTWSVAKPLNRQFGLDEVVYKGAAVFRCPTDSGGGVVSTTYYENKGTSYMTNLMLIGQSQLNVRRSDPCRTVIRKLNRYLPTLNLAQVYRPGLVLLLGDGVWPISWNYEDPRSGAWHGRPCTHNFAFVDGHADSVRIRKGINVNSDYSLVPLRELAIAAEECQQELPCD